MDNQGTLDDLYLEWLYGQIAAVKNRNPARSYWELARQLYRTPFIWMVPNDDNRAEDGKSLRDEFIDECDIQDLEVNWMAIGCSMLEMLIGLSRRAAFQSFGEPSEWFEKFLTNLGIHFSDAQYNGIVRDEVDIALDRVNNRTYEPNGDGGLFPLRNADRDQRKIELWYQLSAYLLEGGYVDHGP